MKNIIILVSFLWAITSYAVAPYGIKGQQQTATLYSNVHQFPNNQVTNLGGINALVETGNTNILANPSFEYTTEVAVGNSATTSWTLTAGTGTAETSLVISGLKASKVALATQTMSLTQSSTLYQAQFADGVQGLAMVRIKTDIALSVCSIQAGTVSTTNCVTTNTDSKWGLYKIPFILGATSNGISIASTGSVSGTVYIDDAFVGGINLESQNGACITSDCTTTFSANVTAAGVVTSQVSDFISGTCSVTASPNKINCTFKSGLFTVSPSCVAQNNGASTGSNLIATSTTTSGFSVNYTTSVVREFNVICQKQGADFTQAEARKTGNVFTTQCGASCVDTFSASASNTSVISNENANWINGNCSYSAGDHTCTFVTGIFTVAPNCLANIDASSGSIANITSTSTSTVVVRTKTLAGVDTQLAFKLICQKQGADFVATRNIVGSFNEVVTSPGISKPKVCHYAFGGAAATLASPTECTTGTCVEVYDSCGTGTPPSFSSTGFYLSTTLGAGTFANNSYVKCDCSAFDVTTALERDCRTQFATSQQSWSSSALGGYITNIYTTQPGSTTNVASNTYVSLKCVGSAP